MTFCVSCGHELVAGRFCTSCGHPIEGPAADAGPDRRTDTAERPAVRVPATPPPPAPAGAAPPPPRFPLFADEAGGPEPVEPALDQTTRLPPVPAVPPAPPPALHRRRPWRLWTVAGIVLVLLLGIGAWVLGGDDGPPRATSTGADPTRAGTVGDLVSEATVAVPATAPPNQDVSGNPVVYVARNMLDGVPETCWRMPGDGTGREITVTLPHESRLRSVGLINGYAKSARDAQGRELDWYHGNRRVERVEWVFDDGSTVTQKLTDTRAVQSVDVDVTTTTITLRLLAVSEPGTGPAARDYTAISDLSIVGAS